MSAMANKRILTAPVLAAVAAFAGLVGVFAL